MQSLVFQSHYVVIYKKILRALFYVYLQTSAHLWMETVKLSSKFSVKLEAIGGRQWRKRVRQCFANRKSGLINFDSVLFVLPRSTNALSHYHEPPGFSRRPSSFMPNSYHIFPLTTGKSKSASGKNRIPHWGRNYCVLRFQNRIWIFLRV